MRGRRKKGAGPDDHGFLDTLFSWSLDNIFDANFLMPKVQRIPESFDTVDGYFDSFTFPLLEEIRTQLYSSMEAISKAPYAEVVDVKDSKPSNKRCYEIRVDHWSNNHGKESYKTLPGDVLILADSKPEHVSDLPRLGKKWVFVSVIKITVNENTTSTNFKVTAAKGIQMHKETKKPMFLIFLTNITTEKRTWNSLHMRGNSSIIKKVLNNHPSVDDNCELCSSQIPIIWNEEFNQRLSSTFNDSQVEAINACLRRIYCGHKSGIELVWGPPGTGKTKTVSMMLFVLLNMKYRTAICAPTNVAIVEVATRVLDLVKTYEKDSLFCPLGDILLFGNKDRLKVDSKIEEIYLDHRIDQLSKCFGKLTGWRSSFISMIDFLEDCVSHYRIFSENEMMKENKVTDKDDNKKKNRGEARGGKRECKSFLDYARERFTSVATSLRKCVSIICTHVPIPDKTFQDMIAIMSLLDSLRTLLFTDDMVSDDLKNVFSHSVCEAIIQSSVKLSSLSQRRCECHCRLKNLWDSLNGLDLPTVTSEVALRKFCYEKASLIFCTASTSYKLHSVEMRPLKLLVIDEAAQLKESESTIPLQLCGIKHAILIGDQFQLSAMVQSNISDEAGYGRSLFERLSALGHSKHLLNIQYRMHPSISSFPSSYFYNNQIVDGPNVGKKSCRKQYISGPMFGPYSFINVYDGREEFEGIGHSCRNMVEVSVVTNIIKKLYQACTVSKRKVSVGVVTPYAAQVDAIKGKLGYKYDNINGFVVKVKSVDGFQGGEEDIIIISTVRSNGGGSVGFVANPQRTNVALTRARHFLWVLGNERTLMRSESVWKNLVHNAKCRKCFFNADDDKDLAKAVLEVKKEFNELDQLLIPESILFRKQRWKVVFTESFLKSFKNITSIETKKLVVNLLQQLASGCRPKRKKVGYNGESSLQIVLQYKVQSLQVICTIDIVKESEYMQILKIWDILSLKDVPELVKQLDDIYGKYNDHFVNCCKERSLEGNLEVPKTWAVTEDIVREKTPVSDESGNASNISEGGYDVERSKMSGKFYSLSSGVVSHLLSDRDGWELELPVGVTDEELEIILFPRSTFIVGRSGSGKTTVLTMKLFQKEKLHQMEMERFYADKVSAGKSSNVSSKQEFEQKFEGEKKPILRQLYVTVSPKLCYTVKQRISRLKSSVSGGKLPAEGNLMDIDDIDDAEQFKNIPNSFVDIPPESFPLVITIHKFLMMLDGTMGMSYFSRFPGLKKYSNGEIRRLALEAFIRTNEVSCDKFASLYWPNLGLKLTDKLESSRVFTEIICLIKGGLRAMEAGEGKLSREDYVRFSESRVSTLSKSKRERVYDIFENYESMKAGRGEFDLADLVFDLHCRLKDGNYKMDLMSFVYIDEVQDLTMNQVALFKYICKNVEEGFVFSGDTTQTIAKEINFRFQDIKSMFHNNFLMGSKSEKGEVSKSFMLSQNFCTHAGVLKLQQSIIEIVYRFFPQSIDILEPETSRTCGELPVLVESSDSENAIVKIFGSSRNISGSKIGFGADQVILVRDDDARKEIINHVGKQALVLTILECKGLEFQDVLLYNYFSESHLKNQWRVIYGYMKEQDPSDNEIPNCPSFSEARHRVLCAELKQLFAAITRAKQRLWIWESNQELSKPMFDYWKKMGLVQVKNLDDLLACDMQVESSIEEWRSRGIELYQERHYEMAKMCFERAEDTYWERRSKASHLKAMAESIRISSPQEAKNIIREAAEIFEAIGKATSAAKCLYDFGEYKSAGRVYLEKCKEPELENAAECFYLAERYELKADVNASDNFFSKCLNYLRYCKII